MPSTAEGLEEDLAKAIAKVRGGEAAGRMARALLERDRGGHLLIGLAEGGEHALYYDSVRFSIQLVPFSPDGVDGIGTREVTRAPHRRDVEALVQEADLALAWVHPRFRWLV